MLAAVLSVKAKQFCIGICACTGQMLCKFSFVLSVGVLQHATFLSFLFPFVLFSLFDSYERNMSAELKWNFGLL